jgi:5'-3' exonuclease
MGIPYYFASLIRSHSGIVRTVRECLHVDVLAVDFNCLIHRYLRVDKPVESVLDALDHILKHICQAKKVIIALDGLVPYGKIVQQRYRRFKIKDPESFDRNQISPDTPYMRRLEAGLLARFPNANISPTQEPGEGEHKIFQEIKKLPAEERESVCIYGLDADLILLTLFNHQLGHLTLLRESGEFNDPSLREAEFSLMDTRKLITLLPIEVEQYLILSVLCFGNDFMPSLGIFSLREDGYSRALEFYNKSGKPDLKTEEGRTVFLEYAASREISILTQRIKARKHLFELSVLGDRMVRKYNLHILDGVQNADPVVDAFWKTFHWTMYYFTQNEVLDWSWVYPYPDAPLIQSIVEVYETNLESAPLSFKVTNQLQLILPSKSLHQSKRRVLYVDEFYSETREPWMKRYDWEAKPRISIPWHPNDSLTAVYPI